MKNMYLIALGIIIFFSDVKSSQEWLKYAQDQMRLKTSNQEYLALFDTVKVKAVFYAIDQGFDVEHVKILERHALHDSPSTEYSQLFKEVKSKVFRKYAPAVLSIKDQINCGGHKAAVRAELAEELLNVMRRFEE